MRTNLFTLEAQLHHAAVASKATIDALPADLPIESEMEQISAASAPAYALADEMIAICPRGAAEVALRARAVAWLAGRYWS